MEGMDGMGGSVPRSRSRAVLLVLAGIAGIAGLAAVWTAPSVSAATPAPVSTVSSQHAAVTAFDVTLASNGSTAAPVEHVRTLDALPDVRDPLCGPARASASAGHPAHRLLRATTRTTGPRAPPLAGPA